MCHFDREQHKLRHQREFVFVLWPDLTKVTRTFGSGWHRSLCKGGKVRSKCTAVWKGGCAISLDGSVPAHDELKCSEPVKWSPFFVIILVLLPLSDLFTEPETAGVNTVRGWAEDSPFIKAADQRLALNAILSDYCLRYLQLSALMIIHKMKVVHQMCSYEPDRAAPSITALRRPPGGKDTSHLIDSGQTHFLPPALHSGDQRRSEAGRVEAGPDPSRTSPSYMSGDSIKGFHLYAWIIFFPSV